MGRHLKASGGYGFYNRATHNLWVLLEEARQIEEHLNIIGDYETWYLEHLDNTIYRPLIHKLLQEVSQMAKN
jgi:7-cyano-7-deazaguanine tRNA-ribosyltransferase